MARCEHDAVMAGANNEIMFLNIKALNEWDSKVSRAKTKFAESDFGSIIDIIVAFTTS